jgi:peptide subunit release factor 1 (eRF1)
MKPVGPGLVLVSSEAAGVLEAQWLPGAVEDHVRVGLGVDALPLLDLIDENEPIAVAFVENNKARLLLVSAGRVLEAEHFDADVPAKENAGGWRNPSYDKHRLDHVHRHLQHVAQALDAFHARSGFRRLVVGGPQEPLSAFKKEVSKPIAALISEEVGIDAHASDSDIAELVTPIAERTERADELHIVQQLVVAAEKRQGAVAGVAPTLAALHDRELHSLVIDPSAAIEGTYCPRCDRLLPLETLRCPSCEGPVERVDLRGELPRHLRSRQVVLEMVHGEAASVLRHHGSIGGLLKLHKH